MKTSASLFTGGGLFDIGAMAAGYRIVWGIENDDKIASVARLNGLPVMTADVTGVDYSSLEKPDHLHASPPCPNFSIAKNGRKETERDIALAHAVSIALLALQPKTFTLENVPAYIHSKSFKVITETLSDMGYWWDVNNLNSADFGVPQSRLRLWVRASRQLLRGYPPPAKHRGWYEAIEDLIPELPETQFAPWQIERLPKEYKDFIIGQGVYSVGIEKDKPVQSITANNNQSAIRAFVLDGGKGKWGGRVVKMTIKALGRFQTVPDWYQGLTIKINGNGVPCLMAQRILETL